MTNRRLIELHRRRRMQHQEFVTRAAIIIIGLAALVALWTR